MSDEDALVERWRKPLIPVEIRREQRARWDPYMDRWVEQPTLIFNAEDVERIRQGYACLRCQEPQETAFPLRCSLCGYAMRQEQAKDFPIEFVGEKWVGPSTSLAEELDRLDNDTKPRMWHKPGSQILIPGWAQGERLGGSDG